MSIVRAPRAGAPSLVGRFRSHHAAGLPKRKGFPFDLTPSRAALEASADAMPKPLGRIGQLEVRLAERPRDVKRAQRLRYEVFYKELSAVADPLARLARRDMDAYDAVCDHLLVLDHTPRPKPAKALLGLQGFELKGLEGKGAEFARAFGEAAAPFKPKGFKKKPRVVGAYRLLRQEAADRAFGFYTSGEFAIDDLVARHRGLSFLELGRSCVEKAYRDKRTVELLWQGIWAYVQAHDVDVMIGCASLEGCDPERLALPLSYLHHFHAAPAEWSAAALPERRTGMNLMPREAIDLRAALKALPPLIKGYLRLGAFIGDGAVIDRQFGTTDVLIVMPRALINPRYVDYYGGDAGRRAS
ncbi:GNAT family N-acetyltransferase [Methylopila sp. Yamaguchi]|uniref:GNAT family N-acetyltransferase n=1 Tax=Methylopila sp. Yamaguchi TaxID=1437817 RepID=UPI000CB42783|nr:hemolysin [Methylopila sp. Yamaguchi]